MYNQNRERRQGFALMLLFGQMAQIGFDQIPPVTLVMILGQVAIFLRLFKLPFRFDVEASCISALHVWYREDYLRLILGALQHADEWHLYYNMVSMLWKGRKLEQKMGSVKFAVLLLIFTPLVGITLLLLTVLSELTTNDSMYISQCHVGFSGVLFALKVLVNHFEPDSSHIVMGIIPVSSKYICWVELVLIHFLVPNSSFLGHLAGILVGVWYIHGPLLSSIIDALSQPLKGILINS
ncbi:hypothetical protein HELRODRAFT_73351 [Helobdella robusta]|uniref:Peptidase S54 rhomboid domain-containing protein n=1 Tax=Helobdella robusta TaxID=6412 RepID=T1G1D0_HELRO|nr:hypothetical protein HELRODRAFT_73351 [Helobdella robusta]ESO09354.1 hypothetical protein HELRODRAFT_73351 [Helobdella robusta]